MNALPLRGPLNNVKAWIGTAIDIEETVTSEAALIRSVRYSDEITALLNMILDDVPVGIAFVDRNFRVRRVNQELATITQSTVATRTGQHVSEALPLLWPQIEPIFRRILEGGPPVLNKDLTGPSSADLSRVHHWKVSYYPVSLAEEIIGIGILVVDFTAQLDMENQRLHLAIIVESSADAIFATTTEGIITSWNTASTNLFGHSANTVIGHSLKEFVSSEAYREVERVRERVVATAVAENIQALCLLRGDTQIEIHMTVSPTFDVKGHIIGTSQIGYDIKDQRDTERALRESQRQLNESQRIAHLGGAHYDIETDTMTWTDEMYTILDLDTNLTPSRDLFISRCHPDDVAKIREAWKASKAYGTSFDIDFRIIRPSGEVRYAEVLTEIGCDVHGAPITMVGTLNDKTEQVVQDQEWHALELRFESGFEQSAIGTAIVDLKGLPLRVNQAVCDLLGRPKQELIGKQWTQFTHPDEIPLMTILNTRVEMGDASYADERRYVRPDGSTVWAAAHVSIVRDSEGVALYYFMNLLDITEYKRQSHELAHMAMHDSLTGLPNRALLADRLGQSLARCQRKDSKVNVMFIDIDNFKEVNDSLGHSSGDELLKHVAQQIGQSIRPGDTVARFGGDEFVVVCDNINDVETVTIGIRILEAIKEPVTIVDSEVHVTASIGISTSVASSTPETLLQTADFAMYRAKSLGPDNISLYDEILRNKVRQRLVTTAELHGALDRDEFKVFYQPVIDIWTGELVSAEALLRWEHASGILVNPSDFIPLAESAGLIIPIGAWVLEQACTQLVEWQKDLPALTLAVNLSVRQILDPKIISMIQSTLSRTKVPTMSISLELTESILMEDVDYCARTLSSLKELGVQLVIDDFGTGYSSLSYLKLFPFDAVKIDRAFVDGLGTDAHDSALVAAIIAMSTALELEVTAEGVETKEQLTLLKELNCHRAQGYYLSRPVCAEKFTELVRSGRRWAVT